MERNGKYHGGQFPEYKIVLAEDSPFTPRQEQIVKLIAGGLTRDEISLALRISICTVKNHLSGQSRVKENLLPGEENPSGLGIFEVARRHTGKDFSSRIGMIWCLLDHGTLKLEDM